MKKSLSAEARIRLGGWPTLWVSKAGVWSPIRRLRSSAVKFRVMRLNSSESRLTPAMGKYRAIKRDPSVGPQRLAEKSHRLALAAMRRLRWASSMALSRRRQ